MDSIGPEDYWTHFQVQTISKAGKIKFYQFFHELLVC